MMLNCAETCGTCPVFLSANRTALTGQCADHDTTACAAKKDAGKCVLFTYNDSQQVNLTPEENSFILEKCALTCKRCPTD
uniref:ShKT domain-containing protein n=1 Tax=Acrobeloides nanus TaxID=290746 RepID=A0A914CER7_9BILA